MAHNDLGALLLQMGRLDEAIAHFRRALEISPNLIEAYNNLGMALMRSGRTEEALAEYNRALVLEPDDADTQIALGAALRQIGRAGEAIPHFEKALSARPNDANAQNNLANALLDSGRAAQAAAHYRKALEAQPENVAALNNLAWLLATCADGSVRDGAAALQMANRADQLCGGQNATVLRALAAAYAETGQFAEAMNAAGRALELAVAQSNPALAESLRAQLRLYQAGLPFRDAASTNAAAGRRN